MNPIPAPPTRRAQGAIYRWAVRSILGLALYGLILFGSAGRLDWIWGWVFMGILLILMVAPPVLLAREHPDLLDERGKSLRQAGAKRWDRVLSVAVGGLMICEWLLAGFDVRFGWTKNLPPGIHLVGLGAVLLGHGIFLWAMASNPFFTSLVRIQVERGHRVETGGPYRFLRHPGYAGSILTQLATPCLLGSLWALAPGFLAAVLFVLRTSLEDRTLRQELPGYDDFAARTKWRLLPGVW